MVYEVLVGNIGTVHETSDIRAANRAYANYVSQSKENEGRAGGEDVTLFGNGEPIREYLGSLSEGG